MFSYANMMKCMAGTGHKGQLGIGQMNGINDQVTPVILQSLKSSGM